MAPESTPEPVDVALKFARVFETLGVAYVTAGSLASSLHGEPRSTNDIDFVADLAARHLDPFAEALGAEWVWSESAAREAISTGASFNVVHIASAVKVDVFVVGGDAFDAHRVATGVRARIARGPHGEMFVDTAEHTVVRKLEWFRRGGEISDRQWRDVVNVLRAQHGRLDDTELDTWAAQVGVSDLLDAARREATG